MTDPFTTTDDTGSSDDPTSPSLANAAVASSIVDTLLDLDALLSADVRRAEGIVYIYTRPDLEARLDELEDELRQLVDADGRPIGERSMAQRRPETVIAERAQVEAQYAASRQPIRIRQMTSDDWDDFKRRHKDAIARGGAVADLPTAMQNELVSKSLVTREPATIAQIEAMRKTFGSPQIVVIVGRAWELNHEAGVSVPKSLLFSRATKQLALETN